MTITYPLSLPAARKPRSIVLRPRNVVGVNESPGSLVQQTYKFPGERWEADVSLPLMGRADGEAWAAFLTSLQGPYGSFLLGDPAHTAPRGSVSGSVTATGAAMAYVVTLSGGSGSFAVGDWISVSHSGVPRLYKILNAPSAAGGTADIWPALRGAVSGAAVTYLSPTGRFMLTGNPPEYTRDSAGRIQIGAFTAVEDLR
ncbi:MAG: hypothetical protein U1E23_14720 [Reyranellaceae bacterium]